MGDLIHIGVITSVTPGKRVLRIETPRSYRATLKTMSTLECIEKNGTVIRCRVDSIKESPDGLIAKVVPGVPRDTIAQLKKCAIGFPDDPELRDTDRFDAEELSGLTLIDADGTVVGAVEAGFKTKANGMIEVSLHGGGSMLLPVTPDVIAEVNWVNNQLRLMPRVPIDGGVNDESDEDSGAQA